MIIWNYKSVTDENTISKRTISQKNKKSDSNHLLREYINLFFKRNRLILKGIYLKTSIFA